MSFQTPTIAEINATIIAQLEAKFGQTVPVWAKAFNRVIAKVLAAIIVLLYKYVSSIFLQQFVQYASSETITLNGKKIIPLVEWGRLVGAGEPIAATRTEYTINITVLNQVGTLLKSTQLTSDENKVVYLTLADVPINAATITATVRAYSDPNGGSGKGSIGNLTNPIGSTLKLVTPNLNLKTETLTIAETVTGADAESWDIYRQRVIDRFRKQPQGGAGLDYELWGELSEGIINTYP